MPRVHGRGCTPATGRSQLGNSCASRRSSSYLRAKPALYRCDRFIWVRGAWIEPETVISEPALAPTLLGTDDQQELEAEKPRPFEAWTGIARTLWAQCGRLSSRSVGLSREPT
jgi:hypothetical protein